MAQVLAGPTFEVVSGAVTDAGRLRRHNEDAFLAARPVFLVADGMGGHSRGEAASAEVVRQFETLAGLPWVTPEDLQSRLVRAARAIDALADGAGPPPGTTVAGVALAQQWGRPYWLAFNVGDSRVYLLRDGRLEQITVDHSRHQELLDAGVDPDAMAVGRNVITRALGAGVTGVPMLDVWLRPAAPGDRVLICSDGLSGEVTELLILATLRTAADPQRAASELVDAALAAAGRDNVTAVVVDAVTVARFGADDLDDDTETERDDTETERDDTETQRLPGANDASGQGWDSTTRREGADRAGALD